MRLPPLALPAVATILGALAAREEPACAALVALLALAACMQRRARLRALALLLALGAATTAGTPFTVPATTHAVVLDGVVQDIAHGKRATFVLATAGGFGIRVALDAPVAAGDCVRLRTRLEPFDAPRNPGEPSLRAIEAERGIAGLAVHPRLVARAPCPWWERRAWFPRARAAADRTLRALLPPIPAAILAGALWGARDGVPPDLAQAFQDTGTVHVLVTAGLHLGVVAGLAGAVLRFLTLPRAAVACGILAVVWGEACFSGAHLPSLRAATMLSVAILAYAVGRRAFSWNAYCAALAVVALVWPAAVGSVSFSLSFSCVGAILLFASSIAKACERLALPAFAAEALALTIATQVGVWPLTAATFLVATPYAPLANLVAVPGIALAMLVGIATLVAAPIPPLASACAEADAWVLAFVVNAIRAVAALPGAHVAMPPPPAWTIVAYDLACLGAAAFVHRGRTRNAIALVVLASCLVVAVAWFQPPAFRVTMLDVGQGDAILVQTPYGHAFMIDAGGALERGTTEDGGSPAEAVGERIVVPTLLRMGVTHLDGIILTHPHGDHVGGCAPLLRTIGADWIADSGQPYAGHAFVDCRATARARGVAVREPRCGDVWHTDDGVTLRFLAPCEPYFVDGANDVNENSIVVMLEYRAFRMLFMGDAGAQSEARILASGADVRADVLKVGHHGSAYSSTPAFVAAVRPRIALISVGRHNTFGHPAARTLATLATASGRVYRTDRCAAISLDASGMPEANDASECAANVRHALPSW
jgi:competence protein ComEC